MELLVLIISFIVFLFAIYKLSREDYVFIRKNVTPEQVFNMAFLMGLTGLFFSRFFFVISHPSAKYFNPLVFLIFPRYPGLSFPGAVIGGLVLLYLYSVSKKLPFGRLLDFFALALLCTLPVRILCSAILLRGGELILAILLVVVYVVFTVFFFKFLYPMLIRGTLKESAIAELFLVSYSVITLFTNFAIREDKSFLSFTFEDVILFLLFIVSLSFFIYRDLLGKSGRNGRK